MFYFEVNLMESQENKGLLRHVKVVDGDGKAVATVNPGAFVKITGLADNLVYGASYKNYSTFVATAPSAVTDLVVVVDPDEVPTAKIDNNIYKVVPLNYGIVADGNKALRARVLKIDDVFTLGASNFASTPTVGKYATLTKSKDILTPSSDLATDLPTGGFAVVIEDSYTATTGAEMGFVKYVCRVIQL